MGAFQERFSAYLRATLRQRDEIDGTKNPHYLATQFDKCLAPWYELNIMYNGRVSCCCYYSGPTDTWDNSGADLDAYWNSRYMQSVRKAVIQKKKNSGCKDCVYFRFKTGYQSYFPGFLSPSGDLSRAQEDNWRLAISEYGNNALRLRCSPLRIYINFGVACNLKCIMCMQTSERRRNTGQIKAQSILRWKQELLKARDISVIGGEPFLVPEARTFIRSIVQDQDFSNVELNIFTNGTLLLDNIQDLVRKNKINICVSLDSIADAYEKIRRGSSWSLVEKNILAFKEAGRQNKLDWRVFSANIIMTSSIPKLVNLVEWNIANDIPPNFVDFISSPGLEETFKAENVFQNPKMLETIEGWEKLFDTAAERLMKKGWDGSAHTLRTMKEDLQCRLAKIY